MKPESLDLIAAGEKLPITVDINQLTVTELKLLVAMVEPEFVAMNVKDRCEKFGCSRETWYRAVKKPAFQEARNQLVLHTIKEAGAALVQAGLKHALNGSFQHWKELMLINGMIQPQQISSEGGEITIRFADPRAKPIDITAEQAHAPAKSLE